MAAASGQVWFASEKVWSVVLSGYPSFHKTYRSTVMMLLAIVDPEGTRRRKMNKLRRRNYRSKVSVYICIYLVVLC